MKKVFAVVFAVFLFARVSYGADQKKDKQKNTSLKDSGDLLMCEFDIFDQMSINLDDALYQGKGFDCEGFDCEGTLNCVLFCKKQMDLIDLLIQKFKGDCEKLEKNNTNLVIFNNPQGRERLASLDRKIKDQKQKHLFMECILQGSETCKSKLKKILESKYYQVDWSIFLLDDK